MVQKRGQVSDGGIGKIFAGWGDPQSPPRKKNPVAYSDRLRQLNLPTLAYRRLRGDLIQTYKIMNGVNKVDKESVGFQMVDRESGTRGHQFKVQKQHTKLSLRQNAFSN